MPLLRIISEGETATFDLVEGKVTLGRDDANTVVLQDKAASSLHAYVLHKSDGWHIVDLQSTNGTSVDGKPIQNRRLRSGDCITIGTTEIIFEDVDEAIPEDGRAANSGFLQTILSAGSEDRTASSILPALIIDDSTASLDDDPAMSFVDIEPQFHAANTIVLSGEVEDAERAQRTPTERARQKESLAETKLRLVQQVSEQLVRIFEPQQLLDEIMSIVVDQTGADQGLLCLLDDARNPIPIAAHGMAGDQQVRVSRTVLRRLLDGRTGVVMNQSPEPENVLRSLEEMQVQSTMCAPLWTGDRIVGIVSLNSTTPEHRFAQEDLDLLLAVAHQLAIGIERSRLGHQIEAERQLRDYLSKYLDNRIVEQISQGQGAGQDPLAPAQRVVTILFSDIVSFTKICEPLEPVELAEFMREYLTAMTEIIFEFDGTIDKYIGDAIMALFGAPVPNEDSSGAAIRAALAMIRRVQRFEPPGNSKRKLQLRVGINTGPVVVGNLGSERRSEYTALGDAVNVASRLETFARPNEICIDEHTYQQTKGAFVVEEIGTIDVKNRAEPVAVYKVLKERK